MDRQIQTVGSAFLVGFALLAMGSGYWQIWRAPQLANAAGNPRVVEAEIRASRGRILDRTGQALAESQDGKRVSARPVTAHATGYYSRRYGTTATERAFDRYLSGRETSDTLESWVRQLAGGPRRGADVTLTLDLRLQEAADRALGDKRGAVVVLDVATGQVVAMLSKPYFNPGRLDEDWTKLSQDEARPLYNRVSQGLYVPGSTFKAVTAAAALDSAVIQAGTMVSDPTGDTTIDGFRITDSQRPPRPTFDFAHAFAWSSNVVFAQLGLQLGEERMRRYAERFGIGKALPFELETSPTSLTRTTPMTRVLLASTAFGQGELLISPLQMAVVAATFGRDGDVPSPYIVDTARAPDGDVLYRGRPGSLGKATSAQTAATMRSFMALAVEEGFGGNAALPGVRVGGKTGTAQSVPGLPDHSWFIGLAPIDKPRYAVAVIVEFGGFGALEAAPVARQVLDAALKLG
ncbi:MAG TPA: penicillin-binding transpeptidase domain-containing protein [Chloroflexota bacterium]|nr:penicillin-binding transpeptidase domain-containing protein [Chloroflexota bacterium]